MGWLSLLGYLFKALGFLDMIEQEIARRQAEVRGEQMQRDKELEAGNKEAADAVQVDDADSRLTVEQLAARLRDPAVRKP